MFIGKVLCSLLAIAPTLSSAHSIIIGAIGDANAKVQGNAIGMVAGTSRNDATQYSGLRDAAVFSFPTIPDRSCTKCLLRHKPKCTQCLSTCWKKKYGNKSRMLKRIEKKKKAAKEKKDSAKKKGATKEKAVKTKDKSKGKKTGKCRKYVKHCKRCPIYDFNCLECRKPLNNGCGRTFMVETSPLYTIDTGAKPGKVCCGAKSPYYGLGQLNVQNWVNKMVQSKSIPQVCSGGHLELKIHQVNADGGGPYDCLLDDMGTGNEFPIPLKIIGKNVPGKKGISKYTLKKWKLIVQMPKNLSCSGTYNGAKNICMVRCHNTAPNGPFGGCIPVQLVAGKPKPPPKNEYPDPPEDKDVAGDEMFPDNDHAAIQGKTTEEDDGSDETDSIGPPGVEEVDDPEAIEEDDEESTEDEEAEVAEGGDEDAAPAEEET
ncbi:hypothetical protein TWF281_001081 [Arthrobotrys megalospora]